MKSVFAAAVLCLLLASPAFADDFAEQDRNYRAFDSFDVGERDYDKLRPWLGLKYEIYPAAPYRADVPLMQRLADAPVTGTAELSTKGDVMIGLRLNF